MKNTLSINNGIAMLLVCLDDGSNSFFINDTEIPSSSWVGSGTYTYTSGGVTFVINKVADTDGNIMLVQVDTYEYSLIKKEDQQSTYGLSIRGTTLSIIENGGSSSVTIPKGDKGDTGNGIASTTLNSDYTLTITYTDGTSWTSTPIRGATGATGSTGPQGPQGPKGDTGNTGAAAGFGTPTASVDSNTGTPSVSITSSGPDTAKIFNFEFHNLKGEKGDTGSISNLADATVDTIDTVSTEYPDVAAGDKVSTLFGKIKKFLNDLKSKKQDEITGAATTIVSDNLTPSRVAVSGSNGKIGVSNTTTTELGYVHGVTSAIQTQLDGKVETSVFNNQWAMIRPDWVDINFTNVGSIKFAYIGANFKGNAPSGWSSLTQAGGIGEQFRPISDVIITQVLPDGKRMSLAIYTTGQISMWLSASTSTSTTTRVMFVYV